MDNGTFSPMVKHDSIRALLAMVAQQDLELTQFDLRTAFLYGELEENFYMQVPAGLYIDRREVKFENVVCKSQKALYSLKAMWHTDVVAPMVMNRFP